jgi:hypothetical protein
MGRPGFKHASFILVLAAAIGTLSFAENIPSSSRSSVFELPSPTNFDRVAALSDVHGMYHSLTSLLTHAGFIDSHLNWSAGKTLLIVVGDSIDKGPQSIEVLDLWISLQAEAKSAGGELVHLLGNHEAEFLADPNDDSKATELLHELKDQGIPVTDLTRKTSARGIFLHSEPLAAKVGNWLFGHAGLFPKMSWNDFKARAEKTLTAGNYGDSFLSGSDSILEAKNWWEDQSTRDDLETRLSKEGIFGVVLGHQPAAFNYPDQIAAIDEGHLIKIDNGMAPSAGSNPGSILIFDHPIDLTTDRYPLTHVLDANGQANLLVPGNLGKPSMTQTLTKKD